MIISCAILLLGKTIYSVCGGRFINKVKSLFEIIDENDDPNFINIANDPKYKVALPLVDNFWNIFYPYADAKFPSQFRKDFYSRIWELWLGVLLLKENYTLIENKGSSWPDFNVLTHQGNIFIEAICPGNASEESGNKIADLNPFIFQEIKSVNYELRIQKAINDKYYKHLNNLKKIKVPYIIAISLCKLPFSKFTFGDIPWIIKAIYPIGTEVAQLINKEEFQTFRKIKKENYKATGSKITKCIFNSTDYELISAIIFTDTPINLDDKKLKDNISIVKNPYSKYPIDETFGISELVVNYDLESIKWYIKDNKKNVKG